jgi:flagellar protein FlaG
MKINDSMSSSFSVPSTLTNTLEGEGIEHSHLNSSPGIEEALPLSKRLHNKEDYELTISDKAIKQDLEKIFKEIGGINTSLRFSIHKETHQVMVKVINMDTNEVIREIPPEKIMDMLAKMMQQAGLLVDKRL